MTSIPPRGELREAQQSVREMAACLTERDQGETECMCVCARVGSNTCVKVDCENEHDRECEYECPKQIR